MWRREKRVSTPWPGPNRRNPRQPSAVTCINWLTVQLHPSRGNEWREINRKPSPRWNRNPGFGSFRGEYLYTANGRGGFQVFDVANIDQKGFSERITSAPYHRSASAPAWQPGMPHPSPCPSTLGIDPLREHYPRTTKISGVGEVYKAITRATNQQIYRLGVCHRSGRRSGNGQCRHPGGWGPENNFLDRAKIIRFHPDGKLNGGQWRVHGGNEIYSSVVPLEGWFVWFEQHPT